MLICEYCGCSQEESYKEIVCIASKNGKHKFLPTNQRLERKHGHQERLF